MAAPSNVFAQVDAPDPSAVTVTLRKVGGAVLGEVLGPGSTVNDPGTLAIGQDGSLGAHQALAVGCQLGNQLGRDVVVIDEGGNWMPAWGRLEPG